MVVATEPLVIRSAPGTGPDSIILEGSLWPGMRFGIVEGPVVTSGYDWYLIRAGELQGWSAMASREGEPWMASVVNGLIAYGGFAAATSDNVADTRELRALAPGHEPSLITSLSYDDLQPQTDLDSAAGGGVVDCPGGLAVAWSPWGDRVALAAHYGCNGVIYTLNADGTGLVRHSDGQNPVWSPDGTRIAFALNAPWFPCGPSCYEYPPGGWEVQVAEVDGGAPTSLTDSPAWTSATSPMWSPDGGTLAFLRTDLSDGSLAYPPNEVHLINADGTGQRFLTNGHAVGWAPDGRSLLVYRLVNQSTVEYWVVRVDGSGEILLPLQFTGGQRVAWSPDGSQLAVSGWNEENGSQTYLVSPDGSDITPIAVAGAFEGWSPDGRVILLSREGPEGSIELIRFTYSDSHVDVVGAGIFYGFAWQPVLVYPAS
jgi:Tol biopolymer transport system component